MNDMISAEELLGDVYATVRSELEAQGRSDLVPEREWLASEALNGDVPTLFVRVPVGNDLFLRIISCRRSGGGARELAATFAGELPAALVNVAAAKGSLRRYAGSMRRAAAAAVQASQTLGVELNLVGVTFKRTRAFHLGQPDWRDAADHVIAEVLVGGLDRNLRSTVHELIIEQPEDVGRQIVTLHEDQLEYQDARLMLRRHEASAAVDEVTLRHLDRYGLDRLETIRSVLHEGHVNFEVTRRDGTLGKLYIGNDLGVIRSHIIDDRNHVWLQDRLSFEGKSARDDLHEFVGRPLAELCSDELYVGMTVAGRDPHYRNEVTVDQPIHFVDAATGRLWASPLFA